MMVKQYTFQHPHMSVTLLTLVYTLSSMYVCVCIHADVYRHCVLLRVDHRHVCDHIAAKTYLNENH